MEHLQNVTFFEYVSVTRVRVHTPALMETRGQGRCLPQLSSPWILR